VDAVFEPNLLHAILAQARLVTEENQHLIGSAVGDHKIINTVAAPVGNHGRITDKRESLVFLGRLRSDAS